MMTKQAFSEVKELNDQGEGSLVFATLNKPDKSNDVLLPGAIGEQIVPMIASHSWDTVPIGKARLYESGNEARADFALNLQTKLGRNWYSSIRFDLDNPPALQQYSYAFDADTDFGEMEGQRVRFLRRVKVHEVSPVLLGAGINTRTLSLKEERARSEKRFDPARVEQTLEQTQAFLLESRFKETTSRIIEASILRYKEINPDTSYRDATLLLLLMAGKELGGMKPDAIKFFREAKQNEREDFKGTSRIGQTEKSSRCIWICHDLDARRLIETCAHEMRHLAQPIATSKAQWDEHEDEAYDFGQQFAGKFGRIPDHARVFIFMEDKLEPCFTLIDEAKYGDLLIEVATARLYRRGRNDGQAWWDFEKTINFGGES